MANNEVDRTKLHQICELSYKAQAVWFLNGFWDSHQAEAEKFWAYVHKANAIDIEKHEEGSALDELNAHRLLEMFDETLTGMFGCFLQFCSHQGRKKSDLFSFLFFDPKFD